MITAHADLPPALAEADVLDWLEELGLDVTLGELGHLLAFEGSDTAALIAEIDFYAVDGGRATQVRWRLHRYPEDALQGVPLADQLRACLEASPLWCVDGLSHAIPSAAADQG